MKKLIKSYSFWTALSGAIGLLAVNIAKLFGITIESKEIEEVIMAICGVLVVFGVVTIPKKDKEQDANNNSEENKNNQD